MITLAFDSTAKAASVAVTTGQKLLALYTVDNGFTQSELLLPMAENIIKNLGMTFDDIGLLACSAGPGSFTGVRIGVALVKGLAFAKNIPCSAVSALDALAENLSGLDGIIVPCMDARRSQVYTATYKCKDGKMEKLTDDRAISISELVGELKGKRSKIYITGDAYSLVTKALDDAKVKHEITPYLLLTENAYSVAKVGLKMHESGRSVGDLDIAPTYLRMPQAERERLERLKSGETK